MNLPIIESERIKRNMSRDDLAAMLGVSRQTIQNWQNGKTEMPLSKLIMLSAAWNCRIDYLLGLNEPAA